MIRIRIKNRYWYARPSAINYASTDNCIDGCVTKTWCGWVQVHSPYSWNRWSVQVTQSEGTEKRLFLHLASLETCAFPSKSSKIARIDHRYTAIRSQQVALDQDHGDTVSSIYATSRLSERFKDTAISGSVVCRCMYGDDSTAKPCAMCSVKYTLFWFTAKIAWQTRRPWQNECNCRFKGRNLSRLSDLRTKVSNIVLTDSSKWIHNMRCPHVKVQHVEWNM